MQNIQITSPGIKKALKNYSSLQAIAEYIWNGFDAKASVVKLKTVKNKLDAIIEIIVEDNGDGIPHEELKDKFVPFLDSEKIIDPNTERTTSTMHGKNGVGRLTFFKFSSKAEWHTVYKKKNENSKYSITIESDDLKRYIPTTTEKTDEQTGTIVTFSNVREISLDELLEYLRKEFGWFLELNKNNKYSLTINGKELDYSKIIFDSQSISLCHPETKTTFDINYLRWGVKPNKEYSRYYCINSNGYEVFKKTTTLNNKGDSFYHSVFIKSSFFDSFIYRKEDNDQMEIFHASKMDDEFKFLMEEVDNFLRNKRRPFLKEYTDTLILDYETNKVFPECNTSNTWERLRKEELESVVRELYQVEPAIFSNLSLKQKKTFVRLLDLVMDAGEKENLFHILSEVTELDTLEREQLAKIFRVSRLSRIIETLRLINDRYKAIDELKKLVFSKKLKANEPAHIQKFIEKHYWIFGEQYHLVTAAEPKFEEALRRYLYFLEGKKTPVEITHPDKNREMDIFMVRQKANNDIIDNIVIELKNPNIKLGKNEYDQVYAYMNVVLKQPEFNASNMSWVFYLVGKDFDTSGFVESQFENAKNHGEKSLAFKTERYKIYVKKWSEIFTEFELNHKFLSDKLELERDLLANEEKSADEIIHSQNANTACQAPEIVVPV